MKFYIGSGMKNFKLVNYYAEVLKQNGWKQTYDWVENVSADTSLEDLLDYAKLESKGIVDSDVVIILLPAGRGAHIELGMALALNKKIFLCASSKEEFQIENTVAFYELPNVVRLTKTNDENLKQIMEWKNENKERLLANIEQVHTTAMGLQRIAKNIGLDKDKIVCYLKNKILDDNSYIYKKGKNWYCEIDNIRITINSDSYTIITVHRI